MIPRIDKIVLSETSYEYDGTAKEPEVDVVDVQGNVIAEKWYNISYNNNTNAGTATVTVEFVGERWEDAWFTGTLTANFEITKMIAEEDFVLENPSQTEVPEFTWNSKAREPKVTAANGLKAGTDYTVSYQNNVDPGEAAVIITGKGNYKGTVQIPFIIVKVDPCADDAHQWDAGFDEIKPTCTEAGSKTHICDVCGTQTQLEAEPATGHSYKTTTTKATVSKDGSVVKKCSVCGDTVSTVISRPKTVTLSKTSSVYNGRVQKPKVTVKGADGKTISSANYTVSYSGGCKVVGQYTVKLTFKGNYSGTISKKYTIVPKGTAISKLTAGKKSFKATWKAQKSQTTGYEIQYSLKKNFSGAKTVIVSKDSTTSATISKLNAKKKYYVRIRTYKKVGSKKYYSAWSAAKYVTTKK